MNLMELILDEMLTDEDGTDKQSSILEALYDSADDTGKELIDRTLICLCGWSLKTLRERG